MDGSEFKPSNYSDCSWDEKTRLSCYKQCGHDLAFLPLTPSKEGTLDSELMKIYHRHIDHKDQFICEACQMVNRANRDKHFLCHEWHEWDHVNLEDSKKDCEMQAACMSLMFENIKHWLVANDPSKPITKTPKGGRGLKASDDGRVDKTPSPKRRLPRSQRCDTAHPGCTTHDQKHKHKTS